MFSRLVSWCFTHPKLFWSIVIVGGLGDALFFTTILAESKADPMYLPRTNNN